MIIQTVVNTILKLNHYTNNVFYKMKLKEELKKIILDDLKIEELSNQTLESDLIYNLKNINSVRNNDLVYFLSKLVNAKSSNTHIYNDIATFYGISSGKSRCCRNLYEFSQNALTETYSGSRKIGFKTNEDWEENTVDISNEIEKRRIAKSYLTAWNKRMFLCNSDGSHRIAAIYRQAKEQQRAYKIKCEHDLLYIDHQTKIELKKNYDCFVVSSIGRNGYSLESLQGFVNKLNEDRTALIDFSYSQNFENCKPYKYCFIRKSTWATKILSSYFYNKISCGKALDLNEFI